MGPSSLKENRCVSHNLGNKLQRYQDIRTILGAVLGALSRRDLERCNRNKMLG
jgi:hypothetical protein